MAEMSGDSKQKQTKAKQSEPEGTIVNFSAPEAVVLEWLEEKAKAHATLGSGKLFKMSYEKGTYRFSVAVKK